MLRKHVVLFFIALAATATDARGYEVGTHRILTRRGLELIAERLDPQIAHAIGYDFDLGGQVGERAMIDLILDGSEQEDDGHRPLRHFHDPLVRLELAGLFGIYSSSIDWALAPAGSQNGSATYHTYHAFSWHDARASYYRALTSSDPADRDRNLADTSRAIGAIMHLVQDASVPAHVRHDPHPVIAGVMIDPDDFHFWCAEHAGFIDGLAEHPIFPDGELLATEREDRRLPIASLFDADKYRGVDPEHTTEPFEDTPNVGLAEFSNANFFSSDRIDPRSLLSYPHPALGDLRSLATGALFAPVYYALDRLGDPLVSPVVLRTNPFFPRYTVDDSQVHAEYARLLIPRAAGYGAAAAEYFFRAGVEVEVVSEEAIRIRNDTDELLDGVFEFYFEDEEELRLPLRESLRLLIPPRSASPDLEVRIPDGAEQEFVVFRGTRGLEPADSVFSIAGDWTANPCGIDGCLLAVSTELGSGSVHFSEPPNVCTDWCEEEYAEPTTVELLAVPDPGFVFVAWTGDCEDQTENPATVVTDEYHYCGAQFDCEPPLAMCRAEGEEEESSYVCVDDNCTGGQYVELSSCDCVCPEELVECGGACLSPICDVGSCFDPRSCGCRVVGVEEQCYVESFFFPALDYCDGTTSSLGYMVGIYQYRNLVFDGYCLGPTTQIILGVQDPGAPLGWGPLHGFDATLSPSDTTEPVECFPYELGCSSGDLCRVHPFYDRIIPDFTLRFLAPDTTTIVELTAGSCLP